MEERLDMLKYFKDGQASATEQWAIDWGEKILIMDDSGSRFMKASMKQKEQEKKRRRRSRKRRKGEKEKKESGEDKEKQ